MSELESVSQSPEPVSLASGDTPASFDELESLGTAKKATKESSSEKSTKAKESKEPEAKPTKEPKNGKEESNQEKSKEVDSKSTKQDDADAPPVKEGELAKEVKSLKLKQGDQETEVRADALVAVKIAGKTEMVPLQDVLNNYSGASHLNRQFTEFKKEREVFESQRSEINSAIKTLHELAVDKQDPRATLEFIAEAMGSDPKELYEKMASQMEEALAKYASLSPEERAFRKQQEELEHYRKQDEKRRLTKAETQKKQETEKQVNEIIQANGMDMDTFANRYKELSEMGSYKPDDITPEFVASYHKNMVAIENVEKLVTEYAPELENQQDEISRLSTLAIQTGATAAEMEEVVKQLYANQSERKLSAKINKMEKKAKGEAPVRDPQKEPTFFDDLG